MKSFMKNIKNINIILYASIFAVNMTCSAPIAMAAECTSQNSNGHCIKVPGENPPSKDNHTKRSRTTDHSRQVDISDGNTASTTSVEASRQAWDKEHPKTVDGMGQVYHMTSHAARRAGDAECYSEDQRPGKPIRVLEQPATGEAANYNLKTGFSTYCQPNDTKTLTPTNPKETPKGPTIEEMLQEIEDQFANTNIQAPVLKQSYNLGTGLGENNPNVYKNQAVNFYVDAPTAHWEGDLMIGHVEIESYPTQMTIQYGNGDEDTFYTMGKPVSRARGEESRKTATSYVYKRSGNFHAYATVSYSGRFRVNGGDWQALDVVLTKDTVDPLLIRVWWVDVGRVGGTCDEDDTRWGCKNDPTMGKKDNPNPRLRKADVRTGQRWHLNDSGDGDTEYSLHRDWPDM